MSHQEECLIGRKKTGTPSSKPLVFILIKYIYAQWCNGEVSLPQFPDIVCLENLVSAWSIVTFSMRSWIAQTLKEADRLVGNIMEVIRN